MIVIITIICIIYLLAFILGFWDFLFNNNDINEEEGEEE